MTPRLPSVACKTCVATIDVLLYLKDELEDNQLDDSQLDDNQLDDNELDDNFLDVPELGDNQPLRAWQHSAIQLKPRKEFKRYTPPVNERKARKKIPPRRGGKTGATKRAKK